MTLRYPRRLLVGAIASVAVGGLALGGVASRSTTSSGDSQAGAKKLADHYAARVRPLLEKYCLGCHSTKVHKGDVDLQRFSSVAEARKDLALWQNAADQVAIGDMPPAGKPQPSAAERKLIVGWVRELVDAEALARAGDPGRTLVRRLNNAEYANTIRDLTGVELNPAKDFPPDSAAGEGFTNTGETLSMSPALIDRYLSSAKDVAAHAVLLPDGFRFSPSTSRRDWTNEALADVRAAYAPYPPDGTLPLLPYLQATLKHREAIQTGKMKLDQAAAAENLNAKYLRVVWTALTDTAPSYPLDAIRAAWRTAEVNEAPALAAEVARWQASLWRTERVGSYVDANRTRPSDSVTRQVPVNPTARDVVPLRVTLKPAPGQVEIVLALSARDIAAPQATGHVVWKRPRFEAKGRPPLLLRDYAEFGPAYEIDFPAFYRDAGRYLAAVAAAAHDNRLSLTDVAKQSGLDAVRLRRWSDLVKLPSARPDNVALFEPVEPLDILDQRMPKNDLRPAINGWRGKGGELPLALSNASDRVEMIPGTVGPHEVAVHPTPGELVGVVWASPRAGGYRVSGQVKHAHPACGNGVAWWLEQRRGGQARVLAQGVVDLGAQSELPNQALAIEKDDTLALLIDARDRSHVCDMTQIDFVIAEDVKDGRVWNLAKDVADTITAGNPHADTHGNEKTWTFVKSPARPAPAAGGSHPALAAGSLLSQWRAAVVDPKRQADAVKLADRVQALLSGRRPADKSPDAVCYDALLAAESPLLKGLNPKQLPRLSPDRMRFGLVKDRFGGSDAADADLVMPLNSVVEIRLPAALLRDHDFVVEGMPAPGTSGLLQLTAGPSAEVAKQPRVDGTTTLAAAPDSPAFKRLRAGIAKFREVFPLYLCFPKVVPEDEVVTLKMFHREDEPLVRLFLDDGETRRLDRLWAVLRFVSRQPVAEYAYLPQFMGYTTQDTPKEFQQFFIDRKPLFQKKAEAFEAEEAAAEPIQLKALLDFAERAYRRPLDDDEQRGLLDLHATLRKKGIAHDEAFRSVLARILASPHFLLRIEQPGPGAAPVSIADLELATRLSYFVWASMPDDELRRLARQRHLHEPGTLQAQMARLLKSPRVRGLATEFGMQWLQVRDIREHKDKSETLFPTFDDKLRDAFFEEAARLFQDVFQNDRSVLDLLDGDFVWVNETLARHYGLMEVHGDQWRRHPGAKKFGRGGVLTLSSVLTKQAGASRTSPVLRGNWVVETLLGEKMPPPPPDVPQLTDAGDTSKLTVRELVQRHAKDPACAGCHVRIDPFGFALEGYDPIGKRRDTDLGRPVDTHAKLRDGTTFDGLEGLRAYILKERRDDFLRTFNRKLLGYALGRSVTLGDRPLLDKMLHALRINEYRVSAAIQTIVESVQFRQIRGRETAADER
jgi:hypothetical protein